jgi:two-component system NtrC family sensor kinase
MNEPPELDAGHVPADLRRVRRRLAARSRELDALQALGRSAAEARAPEELFSSVVAAVHRAEPLDLALVGYTWDGSPGLSLHLARPFDAGYLEAATDRARRFLGWSADTDAEPRRHELDGFDPARGERSDFREEDVILLPLVRAGRPIACLIAVPAGEADAQRLRLLYNASNQLSLHLDRILRAHEAETDRFRAIVDAMPQGVLLTDRRLRILQANRSGERMLQSAGLADPGSLETGLEQLGLTSLVAPVREGTVEVAEGEARVEGDRIWSVTVSAVPGGGAAADAILFVLSDRTESRRLQQQLAHSETMSSLGQMISGVAHELNNPLASIIGYTQLMRGTGEGDEKLAKRVDVLGREAERCRKIVQNLLSFARRREPERQPLSLNQVVENVVALLSYQLRVDGIRLERRLSPDLPVIEADAHQLEQVLVNLLTNASHAIRQCDETGTVAIETRVRGTDAIVLEIRDSGPGIPADMRSKIFDPFFTTKAPGEGTGLGLSLAYGVVTDHGGTIEALAHDGPGTTFRITLPAARAARSGKCPDPGAGPAEPLPSPSTTSARVLVVDDDEVVARLICEALNKDGLVTRRVRGGREALERLADEEFDVILCDVKMPDMNGERLYDELQRTRPDLTRRVLWTTGDTLGPGTAKLAERTGLDVLAKPFDIDDLRDRVRRRLAR